MEAKDADMAVVETITRLILCDAGDLSAEDQEIVQALRLVDEEAAGDTLHDMGIHLASLEVAEMIELVAKVRERLAGGRLPAGDAASPVSSRPQLSR